ncbi:hypothetical protein, partial [Enterobacter hormaechei]
IPVKPRILTGLNLPKINPVPAPPGIFLSLPLYHSPHIARRVRGPHINNNIPLPPQKQTKSNNEKHFHHTQLFNQVQTHIKINHPTTNKKTSTNHSYT